MTVQYARQKVFFVLLPLYGLTSSNISLLLCLEYLLPNQLRPGQLVDGWVWGKPLL